MEGFNGSIGFRLAFQNFFVWLGWLKWNSFEALIETFYPNKKFFVRPSKEPETRYKFIW